MGFAGDNRTHGTTRTERAPGSISGGQQTRVPKGMRMPGRMGGERVTISGLKVVKIDKNTNTLFIQGSIPGRIGTHVEIKSM